MNSTILAIRQDALNSDLLTKMAEKANGYTELLEALEQVKGLILKRKASYAVGIINMAISKAKI